MKIDSPIEIKIDYSKDSSKKIEFEISSTL